MTFDDYRTEFARTAVADCPDMAQHLSVRERMIHLLKHGAMDAAELAEEIEADAETIRRNRKEI